MLTSTLVGCTSKSENTTGASKEKEEIARVVLSSNPDSLDSTKIGDSVTITVVQEVMEGLVRIKDGKVEAGGAESWTTSEDGLTWTFSLRENTWTDGKPVTAHDYVYSVRRLFDPMSAGKYANLFYVIKNGELANNGEVSLEEVGVKAIDENTLEFTLEHPVPYFIQLANFPAVYPLREDIVAEQGDSYGSDISKMVFNGPFKIDQWIKDSKLTLSKNEGYWDKDTVKLDGVVISIVPEETTVRQLFDTGQLDMVRSVRKEYIEQVSEKIDAGEIKMEGSVYPAVSYIAFNTQDPNNIFTNAKVRQAFSISIDRESYVNNVEKRNVAGYGFIPHGLNNGSTHFRDVAEEPLKDLMDKDPKALLHEGLKELGLNPQDDLTVTFLQANANSTTKVRGEYFQNQWQTKLGVEVKIDTASDNATFNKMVNAGEYQITQTGWGAFYNDPLYFFQIYTSGDSNNATLLANEEYDKLIEETKNESDMDVRLEKFIEAEELLVRDLAAIAPLMFYYEKHLYSNRLKGVQVSAGGPQFELKWAYIEE